MGSPRRSLGRGHHAPDDQQPGSAVLVAVQQLRARNHRLHNHRACSDDPIDCTPDAPDASLAGTFAAHEGDPNEVQGEERPRESPGTVFRDDEAVPRGRCEPDWLPRSHGVTDTDLDRILPCHTSHDANDT